MKHLFTAAVAALALAVTVSAVAAPMKPHAMMHGKMTASSKMVYACKTCHMYYSPTQAKSMHYKDDMGHTLVKMSKAPAGYTVGGKM